MYGFDGCAKIYRHGGRQTQVQYAVCNWRLVFGYWEPQSSRRYTDGDRAGEPGLVAALRDHVPAQPCWTIL